MTDLAGELLHSLRAIDKIPVNGPRVQVQPIERTGDCFPFRANGGEGTVQGVTVIKGQHVLCAAFATNLIEIGLYSRVATNLFMSNACSIAEQFPVLVKIRVCIVDLQNRQFAWGGQGGSFSVDCCFGYVARDALNHFHFGTRPGG